MTLTAHDYTIAWVCALPLELAAAKTMLDEIHPSLAQPKTDHNVYTLGRIHRQNIVVACLPAGVYGTISASAVGSHLNSTFPNIHFGLIVGIAGGVPSKTADIRLGDVVVSRPTGNSPGIIQYDCGKTLRDGRFQHTGSHNKPPPVLLKAVADVESGAMMGKHRVREIMDEALRADGLSTRFARPPHDWLFQASYHHEADELDCLRCDPGQWVKRPPRLTESPCIHYGVVASGDQVVKDAATRDSIAQSYNVLCFEMEAAGVIDELPSISIRGICDYCDSHKNDQWQAYAALAAAAYAKALLSVVPTYHANRQSKEKDGPVWMVPLMRNPHFSRTAICGLGGVGKTQIALELAYRTRERDSTSSVFWISCTSQDKIEQAYMDIAHAVGLSDVRLSDAKHRVKTYLSQETIGKWLLIFDNADDMDTWMPTGSSHDPVMTEFLPQSVHGKVFFTTRNRKLAVKLASPQVISIAEPDMETGRGILENLVINKQLLHHRDAATALLNQLALLPLAISQAAAYINENDIAFGEYMSLLEEQEPEMIELLSEDLGDEGKAVATTWLISFEQIQRVDHLAADYLSFMACIQPRRIPHSLLPEASSKKKKTEAIGLLKAYAFVSEQVDSNSLGLHRLVHLSIRNWLRKRHQLGRKISETADRFSDVFTYTKNRDRGLYREYLPHILSLIREDDFLKEQETYVGLLQNVGRCLSSDGKYTEAEDILSNIYRIQLEKDGTSSPQLLVMLNDLVEVYMSRGRSEQAQGLALQVLQGRKPLLGPEVPSPCEVIGSLTYQNQQRWIAAQELQVEELKLSLEVLGPYSPSTLASMNNLAVTYLKLNLPNEAEDMQRLLMETQERMLETEHLGTVVRTGNLVSRHLTQHRWNGAEMMGVQIRKAYEQVLGPMHSSVHTNPSDPCTCLRQWGDVDALGLQVMETGKQILGPEHPSTLGVMNNMASIYFEKRRLDQAEELQAQVIESRKRVLGPQHSSTLTSMGNLVLTYMGQKRWREAEQLQKTVLETQKQVLGSEHASTLISMANLASIWECQGMVNDAVALMTNCAELQRKVLGSDHPHAKLSSETLLEWKETIQSSPRSSTLSPCCGRELDSDTPGLSGVVATTMAENERTTVPPESKRIKVFHNSSLC